MSKLHPRAIACFASLLRCQALKLHPLSFIGLPQPHHCAFACSSSSLMRLCALIILVLFNAPFHTQLLIDSPWLAILNLILAVMISIGLVSTFDFPIRWDLCATIFSSLTDLLRLSHAARSSCLLCPCPRLFQYYSRVLPYLGHYCYHHTIGFNSSILHLVAPLHATHLFQLMTLGLL